MINRIPIILIFLSTVIFSQDTPNFELIPNIIELNEDFGQEIIVCRGEN